MLWMSRTMHVERKETADRHVWHSDINVVAAVILCLLKSEGNVVPKCRMLHKQPRLRSLRNK